jgi:hypothetical protein
LELTAITQKQGVAANDPAIQKMRQESDAKLTAAQQEILGEAGYQQLQEFNRSAPAVSLISDMGSMVVDHSSPLTESAALRLRAVMANASPTYRAGGKVDPQGLDWPVVLTQSQTFLNPSQLAALRAEAQLPAVFALMKQYYQQQDAAAGK